MLTWDMSSSLLNTCVNTSTAFWFRLAGVSYGILPGLFEPRRRKQERQERGGKPRTFFFNPSGDGLGTNLKLTTLPYIKYVPCVNLHLFYSTVVVVPNGAAVVGLQLYRLKQAKKPG